MFYMSKSICFILPSKEHAPAGGYKIVYEYANLFAEKNYDVHILYTYLQREKLKYNKKSLFYIITKFIKFNLMRLLPSYKKVKWFNLDKRIKKHFVFLMNKSNLKFVKDDCNFIATVLFTAYDLAKFENLKNRFYFIQGFETWWAKTEEDVLKSYKLPLRKIVISEGLLEKVKLAGENAELIYNGFNFDYFKLNNPIEKRNPYHICMMNHWDDVKRVEDSFAALDIVKQKYPDLTVNIFGVSERPQNLPDWYHYYQKPNQVDHNFVYNDSAIFIAASRSEGMALPPAEAMICGCALVCTNIPGFSVYAKDNKTALLSPILNPNALANNIIKLIEDNDLRIKIAKAGNEYIKQFTWERAFTQFEKYIQS